MSLKANPPPADYSRSRSLALRVGVLTGHFFGENHTGLFAAVCISLFCFVGCNQWTVNSARTTYDRRSDNVAESDDNSSHTDASRIHVKMVDRADYDQVIARHQGKVVLVDFWATWCLTCMEQFAHTVEISKKYDPSQLAVVSVSMDEPDDKVEVLAFLERQGATFDNLVSIYGIGERAGDAFDYDGALPHYKIYDRHGNVVATFNDGYEAGAEIEKRLRSP